MLTIPDTTTPRFNGYRQSQPFSIPFGPVDIGATHSIALSGHIPPHGENRPLPLF